MKLIRTLIATSFALASMTYANAEATYCDSTCKSNLASATLKKSGGLAAIDAVQQIGTSYGYKACATGYKTSSGESQYPISSTPLLGFFSQGTQVKNKQGSTTSLTGENCYSTQYRIINCDSDFAGVRQQSATYTESPAGIITAGNWSTYSNTCQKSESKSESCASGYTGTISYSRLVTESNAGSKVYGTWQEISNNCTLIPPTPPTPTPPAVPPNGVATDTVNGYAVSPVFIFQLSNNNHTAVYTIRDRGTTYFTISNASSSTGFATEIEWAKYLVDNFSRNTVNTSGWNLSNYSNYLCSNYSFCIGDFSGAFRSNFYSGGRLVMYEIGMSGWSLVPDQLYITDYPRFSVTYLLNSFTDLGSGSIWYSCPDGFGLAPSKDHCSKQYPKQNVFG